MKRLIISSLFSIYTLISFSQTFTAKVVDKQQNPIPFAAIQTNATSGVISNEEGVFTIDLNNNTSKTLTISCLGFTTKDISVSAIKDAKYVIVLDEAVNQLQEVYLSSKIPNADSIVSRAIANISKNYNFNQKKHNVFYRNKAGFNFKKLNFDVDKASGFRKKTLEDANRSLDSMSKVIMDSKSVHFTDALGDIYIKDKDTAKLMLDKVTMLLDKKNNFSVESAEEKAQAILFKYLDVDKSYKVKTGLFKIEDSLTFEDIREKEDRNKVDSIYTEDLRYGVTSLLRSSNLNLNKKLRKFLDTDLYDYTYKDAIYFNNELIHIIEFTPDRAKAKFSGTLYITNDSYAVTRADYTFAKGKRGQKFNLRLLLGVKFIDNFRKGTFMFEKQDDIYEPRYLTEEEGQYMYLHRPIKFIENESRNKVSFDILIEGNTRSKTEVLFNSAEDISNESFNAVNEAKQTQFIELKQYNPEIWKDYNVLEPLEEMKNFKVE